MIIVMMMVMMMTSSLRGDRDVFNRDRQTDYYNTKVYKSKPTIPFNLQLLIAAAV